jgi:hypothetical protein
MDVIGKMSGYTTLPNLLKRTNTTVLATTVITPDSVYLESTYKSSSTMFYATAFPTSDTTIGSYLRLFNVVDVPADCYILKVIRCIG